MNTTYNPQLRRTMLKAMTNLTIVASALVMVCVLGAGQAAALTFSDDFEDGTFDPPFTTSDASRVTVSTLENNTPGGTQSVRILDDAPGAQPNLTLDIRGQDVASRVDFAMNVQNTFIVQGQTYDDLFRMFVDNGGLTEIFRVRAEKEDNSTYRINFFNPDNFDDQILATGLPYNDWVDWRLDFSLPGGNLDVAATINNGATLNPDHRAATSLPVYWTTMAENDRLGEFFIDDFSLNIIPEPASLMLLAFGGLLLLRRRAPQNPARSSG